MKLFWRIFLSFWIATLLMIAFVPTVGEQVPLIFPGDDGNRFEPDVTFPVLNTALNAYELSGPAAFRSHIRDLPAMRHRDLCLFDQLGRPLVEDRGHYSFHALMAQEVLQSGHSELLRLGFRVLYAWPLQSASGQHYAAVLTIFAPVFGTPRFWFNLTTGMLPGGLVCLIFSFYLTRPITKLQSAARRLANGELDARAGALGFGRRDELGDLARDFDTMAEQIQLLMTAQRRFVADVSHELGAPLTRMHLALALLRRQFPNLESGALVRIERETDRLSKLVQQLLLLAGLEAGRIPAETFAPVSIRSLCASIIEDADFVAAHANCHVTGSQQDVTLLAYPNLLRGAIDNVLRNAIRYAPAGTEIQLDCKVDPIQHEVTVEILDCGPGVPDAMLADIFKPFFRTAPGRETSSGGTGLGLAIASEAVRLHDGTIEARNRKSGGLQVTIKLPLRTPAPENSSERDQHQLT
jgi:two-component system sensor histidine kinase CpxA